MPSKCRMLVYWRGHTGDLAWHYLEPGPWAKTGVGWYRAGWHHVTVETVFQAVPMTLGHLRCRKELHCNHGWTCTKFTQNLFGAFFFIWPCILGSHSLNVLKRGRTEELGFILSVAQWRSNKSDPLKRAKGIEAPFADFPACAMLSG